MSTMLTIDEAAERLNVTPRFVRRLIAERRIRFYKLGRLVRLSASDLDRFVEQGQQPVVRHG